MSGDIVIVGDGWAAWSAAAGLARAVRATRAITVVPIAVADPLAIATDADAPRWFRLLGVDLPTLLAGADATFRLGSEVADGARHKFVPVTDRAPRAGGIPFDQLGLGPRGPVDPLACVARAGRMTSPPQEHAFHLSLAAYTALLRRRAMRDGVTQAGAALAGVERAADGGVVALSLADGTRVTASMFVDAGSAALAGRERHGTDGPWLMRTMKHERVDTAPTGPAMTSVVVTARGGWSTVLPLRNRSITIDHRPVPHMERRLARAWHGNVVAIGATFGMLDGTEGGDWALVQKGVTQLVQLLPPELSTDARRHEYNRRMASLHDQWAAAAEIRQRRGSAAALRAPVPDPRIAFYAATGRLPASDDLAVSDVAWRALCDVHGLAAPAPHPLAPRDAVAMLPHWTAAVAALAAQCPRHPDLLNEIDPR